MRSKSYGNYGRVSMTKARMPRCGCGLLIAHLVLNHLHFSVRLLPLMVRTRYSVMISSIHLEEVQVLVSL